jgi:hypothetical protein
MMKMVQKTRVQFKRFSCAVVCSARRTVAFFRKRKVLLVFLLLVIGFCVYGYGQNDQKAEGEKLMEAVFSFPPKDDQHFYKDLYDNKEKLENKLFKFIDENRSKIETGEIYLRVTGYSSGLNTQKQNRTSALIRSNRVKSVLIVEKKLREEYFKTLNYPSAYGDLASAVTVEVFSIKEAAKQPAVTTGEEAGNDKVTPLQEQATPVIAGTVAIVTGEDIAVVGTTKMNEEFYKNPDVTGEGVAVVDTTKIDDKFYKNSDVTGEDVVVVDTTKINDKFYKNPDVAGEHTLMIVTEIVYRFYRSPDANYFFGVKTNALMLAAGILNAGIEVRLNPYWSLDFPVVFSPYAISNSYKLQVLAFQPEVRYHFNTPPYDRFFVGLHAHLAWYNIALDSNKRYQNDTDSPLWGAGISAGYRYPFTDHLYLELTAGGGMAQLEYNQIYNIPGGAVIHSKSFTHWGLTRAGVSFVYKFNL